MSAAGTSSAAGSACCGAAGFLLFAAGGEKEKGKQEKQREDAFFHGIASLCCTCPQCSMVYFPFQMRIPYHSAFVFKLKVVDADGVPVLDPHLLQPLEEAGFPKLAVKVVP